MKTKEQIRDEACDKHGYAMENKYSQVELANMPSIIMDESFKAGWDARDKQNNEALKIALETLESAKSHARHIIETARRDNWTSSGLEFGCSLLELSTEKALAEIKKIVGEG